MQPMMDQPMCNCPPMGAMGPTMMIFGGVLVAAIIVALIALTIFLIRRSRQFLVAGK